MSISTMKSFEVAQTEAEAALHDDPNTDPPGTLVFDITDTDGGKTILKAYKPSDGQLAVLMADTSRHADRVQVVAGAINFFHSVLDDAGASYIEKRLLDRKDKFGLAQVEAILGWFVEEWTGHPFASPSGSTSSGEPASPTSKGDTPPSTS